MISPEARVRSYGVQTLKTCTKLASWGLLTKLLSSTTGCIVAASCQVGEKSSSLTYPYVKVALHIPVHFLFPKHWDFDAPP